MHSIAWNAITKVQMWSLGRIIGQGCGLTMAIDNNVWHPGIQTWNVIFNTLRSKYVSADVQGSSDNARYKGITMAWRQYKVRMAYIWKIRLNGLKLFISGYWSTWCVPYIPCHTQTVCNTCNVWAPLALGVYCNPS